MKCSTEATAIRGGPCFCVPEQKKSKVGENPLQSPGSRFLSGADKIRVATEHLQPLVSHVFTGTEEKQGEVKSSAPDLYSATSLKVFRNTESFFSSRYTAKTTVSK